MFPVMMIDMKHTKEDLKEEYPSTAPSYDPPAYPFGLCLYLGQDELEKLGLDDCECSPGDGIQLIAMAKVTSASIRELAEGKNDRRVELQITHLALGPEHNESEEED